MSLPGDAGTSIEAGASSADSGSDGAAPNDAGGTAHVDGTAADARRLFDAQCEFLQRCEPSLFVSDFADLPTCRARFGIVADVYGVAPGNGFDATQVDACVAKLPTAECWSNVRTSSSLLITHIAECRLRGGLALETGCSFDEQCSSNFCDRYSSPAKPVKQGCSVCKERQKKGAACADGVLPSCDVGLFCNGTPSGTCQAQGQLGDACSRDGECTGQLTCNQGKCAAFVATGTTCDATHVCDYHKDYCAAGTCQPADVTPVALNGACGTVAHPLPLCAAGRCITSTCQSYAADNAACDPKASGVNCQFPMTCNSKSSTCTLQYLVCP